jgi:anti-sigma B factor antagonist
MNLELSLDRRGDIPILTLSGELDLAVVGRVEQALLPLEAEQPPIVVVDLRGLSFMDSSGLRLVLEADMRARRENRRLVVVKGPDAVHRVFTVATLDKRLEFVDDPAEVEPARA